MLNARLIHLSRANMLFFQIDYGSMQQPPARGSFPDTARELFNETPVRLYKITVSYYNSLTVLIIYIHIQATSDDAWDDQDGAFNYSMPPLRTSGRRDGYEYTYEQPQSSYNPGPSQPDYFPGYEFLSTTGIGPSRIPEPLQQDTEITEHNTPFPPRLRKPREPLTYPSDQIYKVPAPKQPRKK